jgi:hypothetical protein
VRIDRIELRLRGGKIPDHARLARQIDREIARRGAGLPAAACETALAQRLAAPLAEIRRK